MKVVITYKDGSQATFPAVESIRVITATQYELKCFGNLPAIQRDILKIKVYA